MIHDLLQHLVRLKLTMKMREILKFGPDRPEVHLRFLELGIFEISQKCQHCGDKESGTRGSVCL